MVEQWRSDREFGLMKVRLLISRANQRVGDEIEVSSADAHRMIAAGQAEPVRRSSPDRAVPKRKPEKASK